MKSYNSISLKDLPGACQVPESVSSPLSSPLSNDSAKFAFRFRRNRAFVKLFRGMEVGRLVYGSGRVFSLSQSDEAIAESLDWGEAIHNFVTAMRYHYGREFGYAWVEHHPKAGRVYQSHDGEVRISQGHFNRHFVTYGTGKLDAKWLGREWERLYLSKVSGLEVVNSIKGLSFYLASYLTKDDEEFVRVRFSQNWVFSKWFEFSKAYKYHTGDYPSVKMLSELKGRPRAELADVMSGLKEAGYFERL